LVLLIDVITKLFVSHNEQHEQKETCKNVARKCRFVSKLFRYIVVVIFDCDVYRS